MAQSSCTYNPVTLSLLRIGFLAQPQDKGRFVGLQVSLPPYMEKPIWNIQNLFITPFYVKHLVVPINSYIPSPLIYNNP